MADPVRVGGDTGTSGAARAGHEHYRAHLDGLRTIAVYSVVAYHAGLGLLSGGFIGVDMFFVLSGFLVTGILVRDLASSGRVRLQQFYSRRARRILPAAVVVLLATALVYEIIATPAELARAAGGFRAAFVYVANWFFIRRATDYFAVSGDRSPVLHFWSLAVEEQFYLVWPMVLAGLFLVTRRLGRWRWWALRACIVACVLASAIAALHIATTNLDRAYYGTDTRVYQLLAGAALALTPQLLRVRSRNARFAAPWLATVSFLGVVLLATSVIDIGPITRGILTAVVFLVLLASLQNAAGGTVKRFLSSRPMTYLGRISYGVYLWHWPVIVIASHGRSLSPVELFVIATPVATGLAAVSFHLLEHPIRAAAALDRFKAPIIVTGFATSVLCAVLVIPAILDEPQGSLSALTGNASSAAGASLLDWRVAKRDFPIPPDCLDKPVELCTVVKGTGKRVVLVGDSNAMMWIPALTVLARERNWNFSAAVYYACPWQNHLLIPPNRWVPSCVLHQTDWYRRVIPTLDPDLVIVATQSLDNPEYPYRFRINGRNVAPKQPELGRALSAISVESIQQLRRPGRRIVIFEPVPEPPFGTDPLDCVSAGGAVARCTFHANTHPTPLERFYRYVGHLPDVDSIDLDPVVCPRWPTCDAVVGSIIARSDAGHLTKTYSTSLAPKIAERIGH